MPKIARKEKDVAGVKDRILEAALQLIIDDGFIHFSMRKLAARLGMTAANIYNYFTNKDELYLLIQTRGFELLFEAFRNVCSANNGSVMQIEAMLQAYIDFGTQNPDYYEIMFSRNTPKYTDYVGTDIEPVAAYEKETALKVARIATEVIAAFGYDADEARYRMLQLWSTLNGIVNLFNSRVLQEVEEHTERIIARMIEDLIQPFKLQKSRIERP